MPAAASTCWRTAPNPQRREHRLRFVRQARDFGFSMERIAALLGLWQDRRRPSSRVRALAVEHIRELDHKLAQMQAMKEALQHLVACCHGDERPHCPILESLATAAAPPAAGAGKRSGALRRGRAAA
ncbi:MAG: MerR family DNA-binding protein [Burkholderiales bacterium]